MTNEEELSLSEFVRLPDTVDFQVLNTLRFRTYAAQRPYLRIGTELANNYVVIYTNERYISEVLDDLGGDFLRFFPKIMSPVDARANEAAGITRVLDQPFLDLTGRGVIIGVVDTGIDFTQDAFIREDGSTKILALWDQTLDPPNEDIDIDERYSDIYYGRVFSEQTINDALSSTDPFGFVPSTDEDGHGTFLASVAAGVRNGELTGAAPEADIVAVKLRRARDFYIRRALLSQDDPNLYESSDFLLGVKFVLDEARRRDMPAVICIGMGSNFSAHDGNTLFEDYISFVSERPGYAFVTAAGNESNTRRHTQGRIARTGASETVSLRVGEQGTSFSLVIFGPAFDRISIGVTSPTGETIPRIPFRSGLDLTNRLLLEETTVHISYYRDENNNIVVGLERATAGIWNITLFGDNIVDGSYWAWLPIGGQVSDSVEFLRPIPESTVVFPATAMRSITCGAYNVDDGSLYVSSSWGPTRLPRMSPDFVAPGVRIAGVYPTGRGTMTGTSAAAAVTSGAAALLLEWCIVQGNIPSASGDVIRSLLISGCRREQSTVYPNVQWGYGTLDLYGTFRSLRETEM